MCPQTRVTMSAPNSPLRGKTQPCRLLDTQPQTDPASLGQRDHPMQGEMLSLESKPCPVRAVQRQKITACQSACKNTKLHPIPNCKPPSSFTSNWPLYHPATCENTEQNLSSVCWTLTCLKALSTPISEFTLGCLSKTNPTIKRVISTGNLNSNSTGNISQGKERCKRAHLPVLLRRSRQEKVTAKHSQFTSRNIRLVANYLKILDILLYVTP